jgi:hypothetical protein
MPSLSLVVAFAWPLILAGLAYLFRNVFTKWVKRKIDYDYNAKLERLKADLTAEQKRLDDLRLTVLHHASARRAALDARRLLAVENVWAGLINFAPWRMAAQMMLSINIEKAGAAVEKNPNVRRFFETIGKTFDPKSLPPNKALSERPFVSEVAWAYYQAYSSIVTSAVMVIKSLELGLDVNKYMKPEVVENLVTAALPHQAEYVKKYGLSGCSLLLDELETKLLAALRDMLEGKESDEAALRGAFGITRAAEAVNVAVAAQSAAIPAS